MPTTWDCRRPADVWCHKSIEVSITWPSEPSCVAGCRLSLDVDFSYTNHVKAVVEVTGDISIYQSDNTLSWNLVKTLSLGAVSVCIRIDRQSQKQTIYLDVETASGIDSYKADYPGGTYTLASTEASPARKPLRIIGRDGHFYLYWVDSGSIKGKIKDRAGNTLKSTFTVVSGGVDDECLAGDEDTTNGNKRRLILDSIEGGALIERTSDDGITFV